MDNDSDVMIEIREEQLTKGIRYFVILLTLVLIASLSRAFHMGWNSLMYIHIAYYLLILGIAIFNKHLPYTFKAMIIVSTTFILALTGMFVLGLAGYGITGFFIFCILSTILFGTKGGITAVILSILSISTIGFAFVKGIITFDFDVLKYLISYDAWATGIIGMLVIAGLIVLSLTTTNNKLLELVDALNTKNLQLHIANEGLEKALDEKNKLQSGLEQAQKMELIGITVSEVAHDLNNVLAASINYPELLLGKIPKTSPLREPLEKIKKSGIKAAVMVEDFLTLARRRVPIEQVVNINHIINETISSPEIEKIKLHHPEVDIEVRLEENLCNIIGSPFHLMQAVTNLISNAAEAIPGQGKIIIETQNLNVSEWSQLFEEVESGNYSVLIVTDTGIGISEEDRKRIFEPFYTKKVMGRSGTGLGMAVVWNTVQDHKGFINIQSIEGKGTTFTLFFPITDKTIEQQKDKGHIKQYTGRGESILVVDDVKEQREIANRILSNLGYTVTTVSSGEDAVECLKRLPFDLVVLNMIMPPGMDGLETYNQIVQHNPGQKALVVSGYSEMEKVKKVLELGAGQFIKKPYMMETIAYAVRTELDKDSIVNSDSY